MKKKKIEAVEAVESVDAERYSKVRGYIAKARANVYAVANREMVAAYQGREGSELMYEAALIDQPVARAAHGNANEDNSGGSLTVLQTGQFDS